MVRENAATTIRVARGVPRRVGQVVLTLVAGVLLYVAAGLIGGVIPSNARWRPPEAGVTIYVESNGVHTGLVLPKVAAGIDWRRLARPEHLADPRYGAFDHLSIGWGERTFYLETPSWGDVRLRTVAAAAIGSDATLLHVDHVPRPRAGPDVRAVVLRAEEYRRLAHHIAGFWVAGGEHRTGYARYDAFYAARGRYSAIRTCNAWTGDALRAAGVRVGAWTPFPVGVMAWF